MKNTKYKNTQGSLTVVRGGTQLVLTTSNHVVRSVNSKLCRKLSEWIVRDSDAVAAPLEPCDLISLVSSYSFSVPPRQISLREESRPHA